VRDEREVLSVDEKVGRGITISAFRVQAPGFPQLAGGDIRLHHTVAGAEQLQSVIAKTASQFQYLGASRKLAQVIKESGMVMTVEGAVLPGCVHVKVIVGFLGVVAPLGELEVGGAGRQEVP
jgi:hypothetical protein